jgi:thymidylate kinase
MNKKHLFVVIDGVDGVYKTTVAKIIANDCNFKYYKTPNNCFTKFKQEIDARANPLERYCFYRLATQVDSMQIKQLLKTTSVICDRYYQSTYAYHVVMDPRIEEIYSDTGILKPDLSFIFNARSEIRDQRIQKRAKKLNELDVEINSDFLDQVAEMFTQFKSNCVHIDTSDITSLEVAIKIKEVITHYLRHIK